MRYDLKCTQQLYEKIITGEKLFEIRKNDRGFCVGDRLCLREFAVGCFTGRHIGDFLVTYILHGQHPGIREGYCIMQLKPDPTGMVEID